MDDFKDVLNDVRLPTSDLTPGITEPRLVQYLRRTSSEELKDN